MGKCCTRSGLYKFRCVDHPQKKCFIQWNEVMNNPKPFSLITCTTCSEENKENTSALFQYFLVASCMHTCEIKKMRFVSMFYMYQAVQLLFYKEWKKKISLSLLPEVSHFFHNCCYIFQKFFNSGYIMVCCLINSSLWVPNREWSPFTFHRFHLLTVVLLLFIFLNYSVQSAKPQTAAIAEKELPFTSW